MIFEVEFLGSAPPRGGNLDVIFDVEFLGSAPQKHTPPSGVGYGCCSTSSHFSMHDPLGGVWPVGGNCEVHFRRTSPQLPIVIVVIIIVVIIIIIVVIIIIIIP